MGGGGGSIGGPIVPSVKSGLPEPSTEIPAPASIPPHPSHAPPSDFAAVEVKLKEEDREAAETDKDMLCPICMQIIKDAFLTSCGHSFCYLCIVTHLQNKNDCPSCASYLTTNQIFPNFLLNKLLMKASASHIAQHSSPTEHLRQALQQVKLENVQDVRV